MQYIRILLSFITLVNNSFAIQIVVGFSPWIQKEESDCFLLGLVFHLDYSKLALNYYILAIAAYLK